jgi:uncharacterized protein YecE (DUF72 family)
MKSQIRIGTSGWNYPHWKEIFYPTDCPKSKWLEYYTRHFDTVELNATFYRQPKVKTFENWYLRAPENFLWAVKANRYITHIRRLKEPQESLGRFYEGISVLKEKLGPILFQLPPSLSYDEDVFQQFCKYLDPAHRYTLEVRNPAWIDDRLFAILEEHNMAFCIADTADRFPYQEAVTTDFVYIRLHGSQKLYASEYSEEELKNWAKKIKKWGKETYVYFDNDFSGYAVKNAKRLRELLGIY